MEGFADDPTYGSEGADAETVWECLTENRGGNGYTFETAFLSIEKPGDALWVIAHVNDTLLNDSYAKAHDKLKEAEVPRNLVANESPADPRADHQQPARRRFVRPVSSDPAHRWIEA